MKRRVRRLLASLLALLMVVSSFQGMAVFATPIQSLTPYDKYGSIQVARDSSTGYQQLCDKSGNPIQLKGMSTFGLQWGDGEWILNDAAFDTLAKDWKCDVIRLAMYVAEEGYATKPAELLQKVEKGIQLASDRGMYVVVDWHMLSPGDPTSEVYQNAGKNLPVFDEIKISHPEYNGPQLFFAYLSKKYGDKGNVLFETANEPNGLGSEDEAANTWKTKLLPYHQSIVDAIRDNDKDNVDNIVICGTDNWSQFVDAPVANPVVDTNGQIMYTMHFYAGTHDISPDKVTGKYWLGEKILSALKGGLALFCTEWGTSEATGDGGPYINYSKRWIDFMDEQKISWCSWSLAKKNEISAAMLANTPTEPIDHNADGIPDWTSEELSITGNFVRAMIRGEEAPMYTKSETVVNFEDGNVHAVVLSDSPISSYDMSVETIGGNKMLKCAPLTTSDLWTGPRISFQDLGTLYSIYKDLTFDVYLPAGSDFAGKTLSIQPVIQTAANGWWKQLPQISLTVDRFTLDPVTNLLKANVKVANLDAPAKDKLGHISFLLGATEGNTGFYLDNIGFVTSYNGDIADAPVVPDDPGNFVSLPFTFETGQREGWKKDGDSAVDYRKIAIEEIGLDNKAMSFPIAFTPGENEWEQGARLTSPYGIFSYDDCLKFDALAMNVYFEKNKATTGKIAIDVCSIPNGDGYWYQSGKVSLDPTTGEAVTTPGGRELIKYKVYIPLNNDVSRYGIYPFSEKTAIRNIILALHNEDSDYSGNVYYDNIRYVDGDKLDSIDSDFNKLNHAEYTIAAALEVTATSTQRKAALDCFTQLTPSQFTELSNPGEFLKKIIALYITYNEDIVVTALKDAYKDVETFVQKVSSIITEAGLITSDYDASLKDVYAKALKAANLLAEQKQKELEAKQKELEEKQKAIEAIQKALEEKQKELEAKQKELNDKIAAIKEAKEKQAQLEAKLKQQQKILDKVSILEKRIKELESKLYPKVGEIVKIGTGVYRVKTYTSSLKTAIFVKPAKTTYTSITIPATVKIKSVTFKVTDIAANAFKNNKKLKKVTIGDYITVIGTYAFYNCKSLRDVVIKSKVVKTVGKNAFKNTYKRIIIKVPSNKLKTYKKIFKNKGQGKSSIIKK